MAGIMDATLNVRMSAPLKKRGDKVLRDNGISTSEAIRALWQELADTRKLPAFLEREKQQAAAKKSKLHALDALTGIAQGSLSNLSDRELEALGMERYE